MNTLRFTKAKAIFASLPTPEHAMVNQYGFYCALPLTEADLATPIVIRLTARNFYRLYVNGTIVMHGPARTAHGYCRVDELTLNQHLTAGGNHIAVEVMAYGDAYGQYSNDCTLESGLLTAEITAGERVLSATGGDGWQVCRLAAREPYSERISHSRECAEIYTLDEAYEAWRSGKAEFFPAVLVDEPVYLTHDALMPSLRELPFSELTDFGACRIDESIPYTPRASETKMPYFALLREHPLADCRRSVHADGQVRATRKGGELTLDPISAGDFYANYDSGENHVGFVRISVTCERAGIIDIVPTELLRLDGEVDYGYNFVTRLHVPAGRTEFVAMEPMIARYVRLFFRGVGKVTVHEISLLDDTYPDEHRAAFQCSDEDINRLYGAAKQTMLLNTLDIFMDCPGRERGGWLCDSLWTARAAALMLSDHRAEREFLENFLLTPADGMFRGFFPEAYPGLKSNYPNFTGITTWSFWLMCEVCEYIQRTGDTAFRDEYKPRIKAFVEGASTFIGKTGLMEKLPFIFIDWSLSNEGIYQNPVSTPANALFAYTVIQLGKTFCEPAWVELGQSMQTVLRGAILGAGGVTHQKHIPDCFNMDEDGGLHPTGRYTEAAMYTTLWTGLLTASEAPELVAAVRDQMGPAPLYPKTPYVGGSGLFIGLCIRLDMLARLGYVDTLYKDMLALYEPQLREGPGTLWETQTLDNNSRCHGFNGHAGVHLMRDVLGLDCPVFSASGEGRPTLTIAPHLSGLRWAKGTHETPDGIVSISWRYDGESFTLEASLPASMDYRIELPREVRMLDEDKVSVLIHQY